MLYCMRHRHAVFLTANRLNQLDYYTWYFFCAGHNTTLLMLLLMRLPSDMWVSRYHYYLGLVVVIRV